MTKRIPDASILPVRWKKSSRSLAQGDCVETAEMDLSALPSAWQKSSHSLAQSDCVETAVAGPRVAVRDSKNPTGPALLFGRDSVHAFLEGVKSGAFEA
ncbi:DUF397 domain-containing protein [Streptomyces sp. B1866]|uniref:DUF397 domain-containing protein n=1 Tax=Streptomyces sp. B1866 TaxID=3075431 RepID=UPI00288F7C3C|nr:DUF397 domain-containing protein [Streptomyces sp. B1866]MDT3395126.1 DUF397 domain-containing protein [Streptomyces sp. B1866]